MKKGSYGGKGKYPAMAKGTKGAGSGMPAKGKPSKAKIKKGK
jgi:hypothetical protein